MASMCCVSRASSFHPQLQLSFRPQLPARPEGLLISQRSCLPLCQSQQPCVEDTTKFALFGRREAFSRLAMVAASFCGGPLPGIAAESKQINLPIESVKDIIESDIRNGQYYVTGNLTRTIYDDKCRFIDPTTDISGLDKYITAIKLLFDPNSSHHELVSIAVTGPSTIQANWKLEGYLRFPWHPHILPYEGSTRYQLDDNGLIISHEETWNISVWEAFWEFFTPSWRPS